MPNSSLQLSTRLLSTLILTASFLSPLISYSGHVVVDVSGKRGVDGRDGHSNSGNNGHRNGHDGGDAGPSSPGEKAGSIDIRLDSDHRSQSEGGQVRVKVTTLSPTGKLSELEGEYRLQEVHKIRLLARGGDGGNGGHGGDGEDGRTGADGRDATQSSSGTDGESGGDGGNGGNGTSGEAGGVGGKIAVHLHESQTHLLMLVEADVSGGSGGRPGSNGKGGKGGSGGRGGSSYSWTTDYTVSVPYTYSDGDGNCQTGYTTETRTEYHSNPGGSDGSSGHRGAPGNARIFAGQDGVNGKYTIDVEDNGNHQIYTSRYDISVLSYHVESRSRNGIFEPGDIVYVDQIEIHNNGGMPTPKQQKVFVALNNSNQIVSQGFTLEIPRSLAPGERIQIPGRLSFQIKDLKPNRAGGNRVRIEDHVQVVPWMSVVDRSFDNGIKTKSIPITYPIEIHPLQTLEILAPGEVAKVRWSVKNLSTRSMGSAADLNRMISLRLGSAGELSKYLVFYNDAHHEISFPIFTIDKIHPDQSIEVISWMGLRPNTPHYKKAKLDLSLKLEHPNIPRKMRKVQTRDFDIQVSRTYEIYPDSDILLVTNQSTTASDLKSWNEIGALLGSRVSTWNLSANGVVSFARVFESFKGKTVIVLNHPIQTPEGPQYPERLLRKSEFLELAKTQQVRVLFLGTDEKTTQSALKLFLTPTRVEMTKAWKSEDEFLKGVKTLSPEKGKLFSAIVHSVSIDEKFRIFEPKEKDLSEIANGIQKKLQVAHPERRYLVVYEFAPKEKNENGKYPLGLVKVIQLPNRNAASVISMPVSEEVIHQPESLIGQLAFSNILLALSFERKANLFKELISGKLDNRIASFDPSLKKNLRSQLLDAILADLAMEQNALVQNHWNHSFSKKKLIQRLPFLNYLAQILSPSGLNDQGKEIASQAANEVDEESVIELVSRIKVMSKDQVSWWENLLPARRSIKLKAATSKLLGQILTSRFKSSQIDTQIKLRIKDLKKTIRHLDSKRVLRALSNQNIVIDPYLSTKLVMPMSKLTQMTDIDRLSQEACDRIEYQLGETRKSFIAGWGCESLK